MLEVKAGTAFVARVFLVEDSDHVSPITAEGAKKASIDMNTVGTGFDSVFQLRVPGNTAFTMTLTAGASLALSSETSSAISIQFDDGTTTVTDLCEFIDANSAHVETLYVGTSPTHVLVNTSDEITTEAFSGGDNNGSGTNELACWTSVGSRDWYRRDDRTITGLSDGDGSVVIGEPQTVDDVTPSVTRSGKGDYQVYVPASLTTGHEGELFSIYLAAYDGDGVQYSDPAIVRVMLVGCDPSDGVRLGLTALPNAAAEAAGGLYTRGSGAGQINQDSNGRVDTRTVSMSANVVTATAIATDAITASKIAADAIGASELAADAITEIQSGLATAASVAAVQSDTDNIQTRLPAALVSGRIDASVGAMAANVLTATAIATDAITAAKIAADAIGASELAADAVTEIQSGLATAASITAVQADTDDIQTRLPAALVGGRIDASVGAMAAGVLTATAIAADAITAAKVAADVGTEIAAAVLAATVHTGWSVARFFKIIGAAVAGAISGEPGSPSVSYLDGTSGAITGTDDSDGNRSGITYGS